MKGEGLPDQIGSDKTGLRVIKRTVELVNGLKEACEIRKGNQVRTIPRVRYGTACLSPPVELLQLLSWTG